MSQNDRILHEQSGDDPTAAPQVVMIDLADSPSASNEDSGETSKKALKKRIRRCLAGHRMSDARALVEEKSDHLGYVDSQCILAKIALADGKIGEAVSFLENAHVASPSSRKILGQ